MFVACSDRIFEARTGDPWRSKPGFYPMGATYKCGGYGVSFEGRWGSVARCWITGEAMEVTTPEELRFGLGQSPTRSTISKVNVQLFSWRV